MGHLGANPSNVLGQPHIRLLRLQDLLEGSTGLLNNEDSLLEMLQGDLRTGVDEGQGTSQLQGLGVPVSQLSSLVATLVEGVLGDLLAGDLIFN